MPGNEVAVFEYLKSKINNLELPHIGLIGTVLDPSGLDTTCSDNAYKKADILINGIRVSIKQEGSSFSYNRLQRKNLTSILNEVNCNDPQDVLVKLDEKVRQFHYGEILGRSRPWDEIFNEKDFYCLLEYLMMKGSPNYGQSQCPAQYILEAPINITDDTQIKIYTFDEYFHKYKNSLYVAIRRSWYGQKSKSEHNRAVGLMKSVDNSPWVFNEGKGRPRDGWQLDIPFNDRKTVYYTMIEKKK